MKKNLIAIFSLALLTAFSMPATVCADTTITYDSEQKTAEMTVSYTVEPSYTVTIPASVNLQIGEQTSAEVKVENVCIPYGQNVNVAISSATADATGENFQIKASSGKTLDYTITNSNSAVKIGDTIISAPAGDVAIETLTFTPPRNYKYSGTYTGTITFTVSVS